MKRLTDFRRRLSAWVLLSVMVPMMVLSALHVHPDTLSAGADCEACVHHQPHNGHLSSGALSLDECLLCQFLALTYTVGTAVVCTTPVAVAVLRRPDSQARLVWRTSGRPSGRAPPFGW